MIIDKQIYDACVLLIFADITFMKAQNIFIKTIKYNMLTKKCICFQSIFFKLFLYLNLFNLSFNPDLIQIDFERSTHKAIKIVFLECKIFGCKFHRPIIV